MKFFSKRQKEKSPEKEGIGDKVARPIANAIIRVQLKFSVMMNRISKNVQPGKLKVYLLLFCAVGVGLSGYILFQAITEKKPPSKLSVDHISVPSHIDQSQDEEFYSQPYVDRGTYQKIQQFKTYMDSLKNNPSGQTIYDSIMRVRPGLLDSALMLETIYLSQEIK